MGLAGPAGIFGPDRADHAQQCRNDIEGLTGILADAIEGKSATGPDCALRLDHFLEARQMLRQGAHVARCRPVLTWRTIIAFGGIVIGRGRHLAEVAEIERDLRRIEDGQLLRFCPEDHLPKQIGIDAQLRVLGFKSQNDSLQLGRIRWQRTRAGRHDQLYQAAPNLQANPVTSRRSDRSFDVFLRHPRPVEAGHQKGELLARQPDRAAADRRPGEAPGFEPFRD